MKTEGSMFNMHESTKQKMVFLNFGFVAEDGLEPLSR